MPNANQEGPNVMERRIVPPGRGRVYHFGRFGLRVRLPASKQARRLIVRPPGRVPRGKKALDIHVIRAVADIAVVAGGRRVTSFERPLTLTMVYTPEDVHTAGGVAYLKVFFYDARTKRWAHYPKPVINRRAHTARVKISRLVGEHDPIGFDY